MKSKILLTFCLLMTMVVSVFSQNTEGTVTFKVKTSTANGEYSPKHVLAIWIKDGSGNFVRSMKVMAIQRMQYLYKWKQSSASNTVNAVTGATLTSHTTHTITWNCTDNNGNVLPDGDYSFWVEFTDFDGQGPFTSFTFTKSTSSVNTNFTDQTYFKTVSIVYTPNVTGIEKTEKQDLKVIQNPFSNTINFIFPSIEAENALLQIYTIDGKKVYETQDFSDDTQSRSFQWTPSVTGGILIYRIENGGDIYSGKFYNFGN